MKDLSPNLMVEDVNATLDYYTNVLGFTPIATVPDTGKLIWAMVKNGNVSFMFQQTESIKEEYPEITHSETAASLTLYIHVDSVEDLFEKISSKVSVIKEIHTMPYGAKEFAIKDCNGYILVFSQNN